MPRYPPLGLGIPISFACCQHSGRDLEDQHCCKRLANSWKAEVLISSAGDTVSMPLAAVERILFNASRISVSVGGVSCGSRNSGLPAYSGARSCPGRKRSKGISDWC